MEPSLGVWVTSLGGRQGVQRPLGGWGNGGRGDLQQQQGTVQAVCVSHGERSARPGVTSQAQEVRPDRAWLLPRQQKSLLRISKTSPHREISTQTMTPEQDRNAFKASYFGNKHIIKASDH